MSFPGLNTVTPYRELMSLAKHTNGFIHVKLWIQLQQNIPMASYT